MAPEKICKNCVYWLEGTSIKDYGYCAKRDAYKPEFLTCDHFIVKAVLRVRKEGEV